MYTSSRFFEFRVLQIAVKVPFPAIFSCVTFVLAGAAVGEILERSKRKQRILLRIVPVSTVLLVSSSSGESFVFFSNTTHINKLVPGSLIVIPVIHNLLNAVGLDVDVRAGHVYWSDTREKAIKRANIDGTNIRDVINTTIGLCDGLAVEWRTRRLYWTDRSFKFIQVARLDGSRRRILIDSRLDKPRGIALHPQAGFVFWTDWGRNPKIERANLDGQSRIEIVSKNIRWPNEIAVDYATNQIFWVDSDYDTLETADLDGNSRRTIFHYKGVQPFGISILGDDLYWSDWASLGIHRNNKNTGKLEKSVYDVGRFPMSVAVYDTSRQPAGNNRCSNNNGGCSYLCLPSSKGQRCACPTGRKLTSDGKSCMTASNIFMLVADASVPVVYKVYIDLPNHNREVLSIVNSTMITYDPFDQRIYWIDGAQRNIHRAYINMSEEEVFGTYTVWPENLAVDWLGRHLYWTDAGTRRIEAAQLDGGMQAPVVIMGLHKPRGLVLDPTNGHMFWTDWGATPKIEKANMDGTSRWPLIENNLGRPNVLTIDHHGRKLYWADARTNKIESCDWYGEHRRVVYKGREINPFGLAFFGDYLYWSDTYSESVQKLSVSSGLSNSYVNHLSNPLGVYVYDPDIYKTVASQCNSAGCSHLCFIRHGGYTCACPSGYRLRSNRKTCERARQFILFVDASAPSLNILPLDGPHLLWTPVSVLPPKRVKPSDLDYDPVDDVIFWTDTYSGTVNSYNMMTRETKTLHRCNVENPSGIGVDWIGRNIYWADWSKARIEVSRMDGTMRKILIKRRLEKPTAIALYPEKGIMFFSDCGSRPKMEKLYMDGSSRITVVDRKIQCPTSLQIDRQSERIYWLDRRSDAIWSVFFNGANREVTYLERGVYPWAMALSGGMAFITDWKRGKIFKLSLSIDVNINITVAKGIKMRPTAVRYYNITTLINANIRCVVENGGCSDLCLLRPRSHRCACSTGANLKSDKKTCDHAALEQSVDKRYLLVADFRYRDIFKVPLGLQKGHCISLYHNPQSNRQDPSPVPASIVYNPKDKMLYWTDNRIGAVMRGTRDGKSREVIATEGVLSPDGIDIDYISGNVYWTDPARHRIEVAKLDGTDRMTLIGGGLDRPGVVVLDPVEGKMYWTNYGTISKIEMCDMDGSNRNILLGEGLKRPTGLTVDLRFRKLYWADEGTGKIESITLNGRNRMSIYDLRHGNDHAESVPFGLTFSSGNLFWADAVTRKVYQLEVATGIVKTIASGFFRPTDVKVVDSRKNSDDAGIESPTQKNSTNKCSRFNGGCSNLCLPRLAPPGRRCACPEGVQLEPADQTTCIGVYRCPTLSRLAHGEISNYCNTLPGSVCNFKCNVGYSLQGKMMFRCLRNGTWTGKLPICKVVKCLPPIPPRYGYMYPSECNSGLGVNYGVICSYMCNITAGFMKEGPDFTTCQSNGMWTMDSVPPSCKDTKPPIIVCPENIKTTTDKGKPSARVTWSTPVPQDNVDRSPQLLVRPTHIRPPHDFPAGESMVTYTAKDESGLTSSCSFSIEVEDKEAPRVLSCPINYTVLTKKRITRLNFPDIKFRDNVGLKRIDYINGTKLAWGEHRMTVRAHDKAGNTADCTFDVTLYSQKCDIASPINGFKSCRPWRDGGIYCSIGCKPGFAFSSDVEKLYLCSVSENWVHARKTVDGQARLPDCARIAKIKEIAINGELYYQISKCLRDAIMQTVRRQFTKLLNLYVLSKLKCCNTSGTCKVSNVEPSCKDGLQHQTIRRSTGREFKIHFVIQVFLKKETSFDAFNATRHNIMTFIKRGINVSSFHLNVGGSTLTVDANRGFKVKMIKGICEKGQVYTNGKCVNCPVGHYYNSSTDGCDVCPANTYQDQERQVQCVECTSGLSTFGLRGAWRKNHCRECEDVEKESEYGQCKKWQKEGHCETDKPKMFKSCAKTCGICHTWQKVPDILSGEASKKINLNAVIPALVVPTIIVICVAFLVIFLFRKRRQRLQEKNRLALKKKRKKKVRIQKPNNDKYPACNPVQQLQVRLEDRKRKKKNKDKDSKNYNGVVCISSKVSRPSISEKTLGKACSKDDEEIYVRIPVQKIRIRTEDRNKKIEEVKTSVTVEEEEPVSTSLELQALNAQMDATQV